MSRDDYHSLSTCQKTPQKWGLKAWVLAESATGYTWNFLVYAGKKNNSNDGAVPGKKVVLEPPKSLWNKDHHVYSDNFYTSPSLCLKLEEKGTGCCGTVRINHKVSKYPFNRKISKRRKNCIQRWANYRCEVDGQASSDSSQHNLYWRDVHSFKKSKNVRRSGNHSETYNDQPIQQVHGRCVDKLDQLVTYYGFYHHSKKWWKRVFFHLVDVSLVNAYLTYCKVTTGRQLTNMKFRLDEVKGLIEKSDGAAHALPETPGDAMHLPLHLVGRDHCPEPGKT